MDLGIAGRKAIVCASSRGLGRACAYRLAEAGCEVVVNGRDKAKTEGTAAEIAKATGAKVIPVVVTAIILWYVDTKARALFGVRPSVHGQRRGDAAGNPGCSGPGGSRQR